MIFIEEADAICREFNSSLEKFQSANAAYFEASEEADEELAALQPPPELEIKFEQYLAALADQRQASREDDVAAFKTADRRKEALALDLGFTECGTG